MRSAAATATIVVALLSSFTPFRATAGIADSPIPNLKTTGSSSHLYSVPGVVKLLQLETVFMCTSLERSVTARIGIEIFGSNGGTPMNDVSANADGTAGNGAVDVAPGASVVISTGNTAGLLQTTSIDNLFAVSIGSARILSTSSKIMCTAMVVDRQSSPPASMSSLTIIKKTSQKGE